MVDFSHCYLSLPECNPKKKNTPKQALVSPIKKISQWFIVIPPQKITPPKQPGLLDLNFACVVVGLDAHVVGSSFSWRPASSPKK